MAVAECKKTHVIGERRVTVGTRALIIGVTAAPTASMRLQITEPKEGTELRVGEVFDVTTGDRTRFWKTLP